MTKKDLFNFLKEKWYTADEVALEDIESHIQNLKRMDEIVPPGPRFYLVANFHTYQYEFVGKGQKLLTGYENDLVKKEGIQFQIKNLHPEDGEYMVKKCYSTYKELLNTYPLEEQKKILLQTNYRFRHKKGHYLHLMEQIWPIKSDEEGNHQALMVHIFELPMPQPFKGKMLIKKLKPDQTYENLYEDEFPEEQEIPSLSEREKEVLTLLAEGYNSYEIAAKLFISYHTVRVHRKNILQKLRMKSTNELIAFGITQGII